MLLSGIVSGKGLVSQQQWLNEVSRLKGECSRRGSYSSKAAARKSIYAAFSEAVGKRASGNKGFGVLFSGGVDSSFIAFLLKNLGCRFTCFSVGVNGSRDLAAAGHAAKKLRLKLVSKEFSIAAAEKVIREAVLMFNTDNPVTIGIAATELASFKLAAANKASVAFTGLGSEEIFAGYQRHAVARDINAECWRGLGGMWQRDFLRDFAVASHFKATALAPFLDEEVIVAAMRARPEWKISSGVKKVILREIAAAAGLPENIAYRPKLAAQYGSGFDKAIERLSRASGFRTKREYLHSLIR